MKNYNNAIECLNSLQTNASTLEAIKKSRGKLSQHSLPEMRSFLSRIGYQPSDLDRLNAVHVAGTKGKGSTSAFTESILRAAPIGLKTGLFTSPHLVQVRERIRVNGKPISEQDFTRYFYQVYDKLQAYEGMPQYFRFLTLMSFHVFLEEKVDVAIIEVGIGGEFDSTNILEKPVVCAVSALGYDHQSLLGDTIQEIAWHKSGIFKDGVPAVSSPQIPDAIPILQQRSKDIRAPLNFAKPLEEYSDFQIHPEYMKQLGLKGYHQRENAALAVAVADIWFRKCKGLSIVNDESLWNGVLHGLFNAKWPGRAHIEQIDRIKWFFDGAHTAESMQTCANWLSEEFEKDENKNSVNILLFNCTMGRNASSLLKPLFDNPNKIKISHAAFTSNITFDSSGQQSSSSSSDLTNKMIEQDDNLTAQNEMSSHLLKRQPQVETSVHASIAESIEYIRRKYNGNEDGRINVIVTGSLHLVGGVMSVLGLEVK